MELDGTFHTVDDHTLTGIHKSDKIMPGYKSGNGPMQMVLSEYTVATFLKATQSIGLLDIDTRVNAKVVMELLPEFQTSFGTFNDIRIVVKSS